MRWVLASDHAGYELKEHLEAWLVARGEAVRDLGTHDTASTDYPQWGHLLAAAIVAGEADRGVLVCGSGIGISIAANRHAGVRAALCHDEFTARAAREHNDANVIALGARVVGRGVAEGALLAFAETAFEGGRHAARVAKIEV
ncbi:MAG: rpiB [Myxococcaceae bacterium]|nr:rpiB [Myxococcaceae bacterium]